MMEPPMEPRTCLAHSLLVFLVSVRWKGGEEGGRMRRRNAGRERERGRERSRPGGGCVN
jgi:hypothetical protein